MNAALRVIADHRRRLLAGLKTAVIVSGGDTFTSLPPGHDGFFVESPLDMTKTEYRDRR